MNALVEAALAVVHLEETAEALRAEILNDPALRGPAGPPGRDGADTPPVDPDEVIARLRPEIERLVAEIELPEAEPGPIGEPGPAGRDAPTVDEVLEALRPDVTALIERRQGPQSQPGARGQRGERGPPGKLGTPGLPGLAGPAGPEGQPGPDGQMGPAGAKGAQGEPGLPAPRGARGPKGLGGADGERGLTGPQGPPGEQGKQGEVGAVGRPGPRGTAGEQGEQGEIGVPGQLGPRGPRGSRGPAGAPGEDGTPGKQGQPGPRGPIGDSGPKGDAGDRGPVGEHGPAGPPGREGAVGRTGLRGSRGFDGPAGSRGALGRQGERGPRGARGRPGRDADLAKIVRRVQPYIADLVAELEPDTGIDPTARAMFRHLAARNNAQLAQTKLNLQATTESASKRLTARLDAHRDRLRVLAQVANSFADQLLALIEGDWTRGDHTQRGHIVMHNGGTWIALRDTFVEPSEDAAEDWLRLVARPDGLQAGGGGGANLSINNPGNAVYITGDEDTDDSYRLINFEGEHVTDLQHRSNGIWHNSGLRVASETVFLGRDVFLSAAGSELQINSVESDLRHLVLEVEYDTETGTKIPRTPVLGPRVERQVVEANEIGQIVTSLFELPVTGLFTAFRYTYFWKTGSVAATAPVTFTLSKGMTPGGAIFFSETMPPSQWAASTEVAVDLGGGLNLTEGSALLLTLSSAAPFSLLGEPNFFAVSYQPLSFEHMMTIPTGTNRFLFDEDGSMLADEDGNPLLDGDVAYPPTAAPPQPPTFAM